MNNPGFQAGQAAQRATQQAQRSAQQAHQAALRANAQAREHARMAAASARPVAPRRVGSGARRLGWVVAWLVIVAAAAGLLFLR